MRTCVCPWITRLGWLALASAVPMLAGCNPPSRAEALRRAQEMLPRALVHEEPTVRSLALEAYRDLGRPPPKDALGGLLRAERESVRFTAMLLKAERAGKGDLRLFRRVYRTDRSPSVRLAAVYGMARQGDVSRMEALAEGLAAKDPVVRRNAATILGLLDNPSAVPMLRERMKQDEDPVVRSNVNRALRDEE